MKGKRIGKYAAGFFLFVLFLFLFDRGLFYLIYKAERNFYSRNEFEERFEKYMEGKSFSTLILGTSRTYEGIHPVYLENALGERMFKETYRGKGPRYNYYFYKLYKKYAGVPKVVIYGVDYFIYSISSDLMWMARFDLDEPGEKIDFFTSPLMLVDYKEEIDNFYNNIMIRLKEKRNVEAEKNVFDDIIAVQRYTGIQFRDKKLNNKKSGGYKVQRFRKFPGEEGRFFIKLLDQLKQDNVTVILVSLPDYIGTFRTNHQRTSFMTHLKSLKHDYPNLYIYNYNKPKEFPLSNEDYFNDGGFGQTNSHLSKLGARLLCKKLAEDIRKHYK
jgi:hypothetical protein